MIKKLIILAAGKGTRLLPLTKNIPKCMTPILDKTILGYQLEVAKKCGITEVIIVGGYKIDKINYSGITMVRNKNFDTTDMVESLNCANKHFKGGFIVSYGDIIFSETILAKMMESKNNISVAADMKWKKYWIERFEDPLIDAETFKFGEGNEIIEIGNSPKNIDEIESQYIGLLAFSCKGSDLLKDWISKFYENKKICMTDMINEMIKNGYTINAEKIYGDWLEIDSLKDLDIAKKKLSFKSNGKLSIRR